MASFISVNDFQAKAKVRREQERILTWSDLKQNHIYQITAVRVSEGGKYDTSYILYLTDKENQKVKVWSPKNLVGELKRKEPTDIPYIISLGKEPFGTNKTLNNYDLAFEKGEKILSFFF